LRVRNIKLEGELKDDLKDGLVLINLMEVLSGEKCPEKYNTKITLDMHRIENTTIAISFITKHVGKLSVSSTGTQPSSLRSPKPPTHAANLLLLPQKMCSRVTCVSSSA
jgi:hypothetical protein